MIALTNKNFYLFAAKFYDNPNCEGTEEFEEDLQKFKYIKRLFTKYVSSGDIKERLVLNHIVVLYNLFGRECTRMLFLKLEGQWSLLVPFLYKMNQLPELVRDVGKHVIIDTRGIVMDEYILEKLKDI